MQSTLEATIEQITGERVIVLGSGRTDAGAHALQQVVAFDTTSRLEASVLQRAMNAQLPRDIAVTSAGDAPPGFHPRHAAESRVYCYLVWNRQVRSPFWEGRAAHIPHPLDVERMQEAAQTLIGVHDFSSFVASTASGDRRREVYRIDCRREGFLVTIEVQGTGFMRQMVRAIVGTLILVGSGRIEPEELGKILDEADRRLGGETAPAGGLYLMQVNYGQDIGEATGPSTAVHGVVSIEENP